MEHVDPRKLKGDVTQLLSRLEEAGASKPVLDRLRILERSLSFETPDVTVLDSAVSTLDRLLNTRHAEKTRPGSEGNRRRLEDLKQEVVFLREQVMASKRGS